MKNPYKIPVFIGIILCLAVGGIYAYEKSETEVVSVTISVNSMNENVYSLLDNTTILGQKYLHLRNEGDAFVLNAIDPKLMSLGDSCGATVEATLEIKNPKLENHYTLHGDLTTEVDIIRVISHSIPKRTCAY